VVQRATARVGCSGWHYKQWRGTIYPETLAPAGWLREYTRRFTTVELNNTFYRLPPLETFVQWRAQVTADFQFAIKASRFLTHIKRLRDPEEPVGRLFERLTPLGPTIGPILYQLPPRWLPDPERLEIFLAALPRTIAAGRRRVLHHVIEMRDPRGYAPWVLERLAAYGVSLCLHDMPGSESPRTIDGPIVYIRFHGHGAKYGGSYPDQVLDEWAALARRALAEGRDVHAYFNNDVGGAAVFDAERFRARVNGQRPVRRASAAAGRRLA
jgi:uncharacterized protein YecE (DUF72 family)